MARGKTLHRLPVWSSSGRVWDKTVGSEQVGFIENPKKIPGRYIAGSGKRYGPHAGVESVFTPDEPDALDAGDGVEGIG